MSAHLALGAVAALALAAAGYRRKQGSTSAPPRFDAESDYVVEGVGEKSGRFIRIPAHAAGLGGTPNNENVDYLGFVVWMTPSDFLRLNPDRPVPPRPQSKARVGAEGDRRPDAVRRSRGFVAEEHCRSHWWTQKTSHRQPWLRCARSRPRSACGAMRAAAGRCSSASTSAKP